MQVGKPPWGTHSPTNSRSIILHWERSRHDPLLLRLCLSSVASSGLDSSVWRSVVKWKMLAGSYRRTIHGRQRHLPFARPVKQSKPSSVASRQIQTSIAASQMMSHPRDSENCWQGCSSQLLVFSWLYENPIRIHPQRHSWRTSEEKMKYCTDLLHKIYASMINRWWFLAFCVPGLHEKPPWTCRLWFLELTWVAIHRPSKMRSLFVL